jgi:hypothetical protein
VSEDLQRQPDGVPHKIVGLTALFSVMLAALLTFMFMTGGRTTKVGAVMIAVLAIPVIVNSLYKKAEHDRDHVHPSR